jgi:hypothetical protein
LARLARGGHGHGRLLHDRRRLHALTSPSRTGIGRVGQSNLLSRGDAQNGRHTSPDEVDELVACWPERVWRSPAVLIDGSRPRLGWPECVGSAVKARSRLRRTAALVSQTWRKNARHGGRSTWYAVELAHFQTAGRARSGPRPLAAPMRGQGATSEIKPATRSSSSLRALGPGQATRTTDACARRWSMQLLVCATRTRKVASLLLATRGHVRSGCGRFSELGTTRADTLTGAAMLGRTL